MVIQEKFWSFALWKYCKDQSNLAQVRHSLGKETIIVLTGQRRVGKSYVLMSLRDLLSASADNNVIYINKEKSAGLCITKSTIEI